MCIVNDYTQKYMNIPCVLVHGSHLIYSIVQIYSIYDVNLKAKNPWCELLIKNDALRLHTKIPHTYKITKLYTNIILWKLKYVLYEFTSTKIYSAFAQLLELAKCRIHSN